MSRVLKIDETAINTRRRAEQIAQRARLREYSAIDLSNVEFISRSVADELVHQSMQHDLELCGLNDEVSAMVDAVSGKTGTPVQ